MTADIDTWHTVEIFYKVKGVKKLLCRWIKPPLNAFYDGLSWFEAGNGSRRHMYTPDTGYLGAIPQTFLPSIGLAVEDFQSANLYVES